MKKIDGSKNFQIASLKSYLTKSCPILLKLSEIHDQHLIINSWTCEHNSKNLWKRFVNFWNYRLFVMLINLINLVSMILGKCVNVFAYCTGLQGWAIYTNPLWFGSNRNGKWQIAKLNELDDATSSKCLIELIRQCWPLCWP